MTVFLDTGYLFTFSRHVVRKLLRLILMKFRRLVFVSIQKYIIQNIFTKLGL